MSLTAMVVLVPRLHGHLTPGDTQGHPRSMANPSPRKSRPGARIPKGPKIHLK